MRKITYEKTYHDYSLSRTWKSDQGFYVEILDRLVDFDECIRENYKKAFIFSFQLNFPAGYSSEVQTDNALFSKYIEELRFRYHRDGITPLYFWVREQSMSTNQFHYHVIFVVDGNMRKNDYHLQNVARDLWHQCLGIPLGTGPFREGNSFIDGTRNGVMIKQNEKYAGYKHHKFFEFASYLAKVYSKGQSAPNVKEFGSSRIPRNGERIFRRYTSSRRDIGDHMSINYACAPLDLTEIF